MSNQATNTAAAAAPAKAKKPSIVDTFLKGCAKGFKVGIENITPAMILGYVLHISFGKAPCVLTMSKCPCSFSTATPIFLPA